MSWTTGIIIGGVFLALAAFIVAKVEWDSRHAPVFTEAFEETSRSLAADLTIPDPPEFASNDEIHSFYAELKDKDPTRAGKAMYDAALKIHGR